MDDDRTTIERGLDGARPASARGSDAGRTLDARERGVRLFLSSTVHVGHISLHFLIFINPEIILQHFHLEGTFRL